MEKTWKPIVAGILGIVSGVFSLLGVFGVIIAIAAAGNAPFILTDIWTDLGTAPSFVQSILVVIAIFLAIVGILPLIRWYLCTSKKEMGSCTCWFNRCYPWLNAFGNSRHNFYSVIQG